MGRRKSASTAKPFSAMYPAKICDALNRIGEADVCPRSNLVMGKMEFIGTQQDKWFALIHWVAYEILPIVDIHRPPYTQKSFKDLRNFGEFIFALLQLCKACFKHDNAFARRNGKNPYDYWVECVIEIKAFYFSTHKVQTKEYLVSLGRYFCSDLEQGRIPTLLTSNLGFESNLKLCQVAQSIRLFKNNSFMNVWDFFLGSCRIAAEEFRSDQTKIVTFNKEGGALLKYKNTLKPVNSMFFLNLPDFLKSMKVVDFSFRKRLWSEYGAYPLSSAQ